MSDHISDIRPRRANPLKQFRMAAGPATRFASITMATVLACCAFASPAHAQKFALAQVSFASPLVAYTVNESGGRISIADAQGDSAAVESIRLSLLETAAAIRRGDFRTVTLFRLDAPEVRVLADRHLAVRCLFRAVPRGGELVLLSDDDRVVAAIHQLLASPPPRELEF